MLDDKEVAVHPRTPMPPHYSFVPKGNIYVTGNCRRKTHEAGQTVYVVTLHKKVLGLRCPTTIVQAVRAAEQSTRAARQDATAKRDAALAATFRKGLLEHYPKVPADTVPEIVQHALKKHERRVARTGTLDEAARVRLAVRAHIRHRWTDYEKILRAADGGGKRTKKKKNKGKRRDGRAQRLRRAEARLATLGRVDAIEQEWAGGKLPVKQSGRQAGPASGKGPIEGSEESMEESSDSEEDDDEEEDEDDDEGESDGVVTDQKSSKSRNRRSGKGASIASRRTQQPAARRGRKGNTGRVAGSRVQKTSTTASQTTSRHPRSSKSQATARITRCQQKLDRVQAAAARGEDKETAIVIDSDSEWEP